MIVSINQPAYQAWPGYYDRIAASDLHVVLDHVQFEKNSYVNRNKVRTPGGWTWMTVPVSTKGKFNDLQICSLSNSKVHVWPRKHLNTIRANYARSRNFGDLFAELEVLYRKAEGELSFLSPVMSLSRWLMERLEIDTPIVYSSEMFLDSRGSGLVLDICRATRATKYLSGPLGRNYLDLSAFRDAGIEVAFHGFESREYRQAWPGFVPGLSALDLLMNESRENVSRHLGGGRRLERA